MWNTILEHEELHNAKNDRLQIPQLDSLSEDGAKPKSVEGKLEFRNLCFSYPSRRGVQVLNNVSFSVAAGESVALVGQSGEWAASKISNTHQNSGSGKSTIFALLQRFYDLEPGCGEVECRLQPS